MMAKNDITGDNLISRVLSPEGEKQFEKIFGVKKKEKYIPPPLPVDVVDTSWGDGESRIENIGRNSNDGLHYDKI
jgi:hypothetical protein